MARSSVTLSDRQGIIDIPLCYHLSACGCILGYSCTKSSQLLHREKRRKKESTAQISPVKLKIERPRATFNSNASRMSSVVENLILEHEMYLGVAVFEELCIGGRLNRVGNELMLCRKFYFRTLQPEKIRLKKKKTATHKCWPKCSTVKLKMQLKRLDE